MRLFLTFCLLFSFSIARDFDRYDLIGDEKSSRLLIIGGIHGDEPGGYFGTALFVKHYKIKKGSVTVIPNLNFNSILRNQRGVYGDMNRKFGEIKKSDKDYNNITNVKNIILEKDVAS